MRQQYRIVDVLGRGPVGVVYLAERIGGAGGRVALKILDGARANAAAVARLEQELPRLGWVKDARVVRVQSLVRFGGAVGLISEFVGGCDLGRLLRQGQVPPGAAMEIVTGLAGALHAGLFQPGPDGEPLLLSHNDVRLTNVMLTPYGEIRLLDAGVVRALAGGDPAELRRLDPELRAAPEVAGGGRLTPAADVYACGLILFELLAGRPLLRAGQDAASHRQLVSQATAQLLASGVDPMAVMLADALLTWEPESRPLARDVEKLARDLRRNVGGASLRDWASEVVPGVMDDDERVTDALVGTTLSVEESVARPAAASKAPAPLPLPAPRYDARAVDFGDEDETVTATLPGRHPSHDPGPPEAAVLEPDPVTYHGPLEPEVTDTMVMRRPPEVSAAVAAMRLPPVDGPAREAIPAPPSRPPVSRTPGGAPEGARPPLSIAPPPPLPPPPSAPVATPPDPPPPAAAPLPGLARGAFVPGGASAVAPPLGPPRPRLVETDPPLDLDESVEVSAPGPYRPGGSLPRHPLASPESARLDDVPPVPATPAPPPPRPPRQDPPSLAEPPREEYREGPRDLLLMALPAGCFLLALLAAGAFYAWLRFR